MNYSKIAEILDSAKSGTGSVVNSLKHSDFLRNAKASEVLAALKLNDIVKEEEQKKKTNCLVTILAVIGAIAAIIGIAYALYCYFTPDYLEDFDEDFEEELENDFFEDEEDDEKSGSEGTAEA